jgi:hypothetical protein
MRVGGEDAPHGAFRQEKPHFAEAGSETVFAKPLEYQGIGQTDHTLPVSQLGGRIIQSKKCSSLL